MFGNVAEKATSGIIIEKLRMRIIVIFFFVQVINPISAQILVVKGSP